MVLSSPRLKACYDARGAEGLLEREGWQWDGDAEGVFEPTSDDLLAWGKR